MKRRKIPLETFWIGAAVGVCLGVPLATLAIYALPRVFGVGEAESSMGRIARLSVIFAGFPAFLAGGGVARLVAHRYAERVAKGTLGADLAVGAAAGALAGIGTVVLTAVPVGGMPEIPLAWLWVIAVGAISGALTGSAIGVLIGVRMRRRPRQEEARPS
jgi:hypothetical protein